jgi:hypothetical protein
MCASPVRGAAVADATAEHRLRLSAFRLRFFFRSFFPSSVPKRRFANASTGIGLLRFRMEHRSKSVATVHDRGLPQLGRKDASPRTPSFICNPSP